MRNRAPSGGRLPPVAETDVRRAIRAAQLGLLVNDVLGAGFQLEALDEPVLPNSGLWAEVPTALIVVASAP